MKKNIGGHKETKEIWVAGVDHYYCDFCSAEIEKSKVKGFSFSPDVRYDNDLHFCNYEHMNNFINDKSPFGDYPAGNLDLKKLDYALKNVEGMNDDEIIIVVKGLKGLRELLEPF